MEDSERDEKVKATDELSLEEIALDDEHEDAERKDVKDAEETPEDDEKKEVQEAAERKERSEEVKVWLSEEKHPRTSKAKIRIGNVKARAKKEIFRGGIGAKRKQNGQENNKEKMLASELVEKFDAILRITDSKNSEIQSSLNNHENDKKETEIILSAASQGMTKNAYTKFLKTKYADEDDLEITKNLVEGIGLIGTTTRLHDALYESAQRQIRIRQLVTEFARDFVKEKFPADAEIDITMVDDKIREEKRLRDFYDAVTAASYHNLMAELALRIAIILTTIKDFQIYKNLLLGYPLDFSRYQEIDKITLRHFTEIYTHAFRELIIVHDDGCPDDADKNLKSAYQINNEMADFYETLKEPMTLLAQEMTALEEFLSKKENYATEKKDELTGILKSVERAGKSFEKTTDSATQELRNYIWTDMETLGEDADEHVIPEILTILNTGGLQIVDIMNNYNGAKLTNKDLLWKALEAKEKYLPEMQALITALINLYQLEREKRARTNIGVGLIPREDIENYYRHYTGFFEIIFRNMTSVATYLYNAVHHQATDIAADGPDGELVRSIDLTSKALREICRRMTDEHYVDLMIFSYQNIFAESENEDYLYYMETENQIMEMMRKYLPAALMPSMRETSEAITRVSAILDKYDNLKVSPSGIRDAMTEEDKKEMAALIAETRADINHYMSWHTDNGIGSLYNLYDFTIYSPEVLIKKAKPKDLMEAYLATAEENTQAKKLLDEERKVKNEIQKLAKTDKDIYLSLKECTDSYEIMLGMYRQFFTLFNQRNLNALRKLRESKDDEKFNKEIMLCDEAKVPQVKNVLMNFARSYARFSKQYISLVQEYINTTRIFYQGLPEYNHEILASLKCISAILPSIQKMLINIRTSLEIMQSDLDPMIAKYMKTLLMGIEKCWVGDLDLVATEKVRNNLNTLADKLSVTSEISQEKTKGYLRELNYHIVPLAKWVEEKMKIITEKNPKETDEK